MRRIRIQSTASQKKARPKAWKLKKRMLQKKLKASCSRNSRRLLVRAGERGAIHTLAAPMPISA